VRVRIKFCGMTRPEDAAAAAAAGADAIGIVFAPDTPRYVEPGDAAAICAALPPLVSRVGVFVDPDPAWVREVLSIVTLDLLQFHGGEPAAFCTGFRVPYIKAVRVRGRDDILRAGAEHPAARALLLDAFVSGRAGGTGVTFPWSEVPAGLRHPVILAGGLDEGNVADAIAAVHPFAVDVSGSVEARPRVKDPGKMQRFAAAVRAAGV
jgi:phosphoribosylanthranilate isomerase